MKLLLFLFLAVAVEAAPCKDKQQCASCHPNGRCSSKCYDGYYGYRCKHRCSPGCKNNVCHFKNNVIDKCLFGCKVGFYGNRCHIPCDTHTNTCMKCPKDCEGGFCQLGPSCAQGCQDSYYGTSCKSCPAGCEVCDRVSGTCEICLHCEGNCTHGCLEGCKPGYFGDFCEHTCKSGCLSGCDQTSGDCFKCKSGWFGASCENRCPKRCVDEECDRDEICSRGCTKGWFGVTCKEHCPHKCMVGVCDINGNCTSGCTKGWFGQTCEARCSKRCFAKDCDQVGICTQGCKDGWYGPHCESNCTTGCRGETCARNGICLYGCKVGFYGLECETQCSASCLNKVCDDKDGSCKSCEEGSYGGHCNKSCLRCDEGSCLDACNVAYGVSSAEGQQYFIAGVCLVLIIFVVVVGYVTYHIKQLDKERNYKVNLAAQTGNSTVEQEDSSLLDITSESDCSQAGVQVVVLKQPDGDSLVSVKNEVVDIPIVDGEALKKIIVGEDLTSVRYNVRKLDIAGKKGESRVTSNASVFGEDKTEMIVEEASEYENAVVDGRALRENGKTTASWSGNVNQHGKDKIKIVLERDTEDENGVDDRNMVRKKKKPYSDRCFHEGKDETNKFVEDDLLFDNGVDDKKPLNVCLSTNPSDDGNEKMFAKDGIEYEDTEEATKQDEIDNFNDGQDKGSDTARDTGFDCVDEAAAAKSTDKASKGDEPFEDHDVTGNTGIACDGNGTTVEPAKGNQDTLTEPTVREHQTASVAINEHDDEKHYVEVFLLND